MIISSSVSVGQITFILRVAIQILKYCGPILISLIILARVPVVAPIDIHGMMNRIVASAYKSTIKWILDHSRHKHAGPTPASSFSILLILLLLFTSSIILSDIGFLGFFSCSIPTANVIDFPASVTSENSARALIQTYLSPGIEESMVKAVRCNSSKLIQFPTHVPNTSALASEFVCDSWNISTFGDAQLFKNINSTDSDALMPRRLSNISYEGMDLDTFGLSTKYKHRVIDPLIQNGIVVVPHEGGVWMVMGVPQLSPNKNIELVKTMAVEFEVGCMTVGIRDAKLVDNEISSGRTYFKTNGTWWNYTGPDYMEEALNRTVDDCRAYIEPYYNRSTLDSNGEMKSMDIEPTLFSKWAAVMPWNLPSNGTDFNPLTILDNCTKRMETMLGTQKPDYSGPGDMCTLLGVRGTSSSNGVASQVFERMVCAFATQVNMVNATITVNAEGQVSGSLAHVPSNLHLVVADGWSTYPFYTNNTIAHSAIMKYVRHTLSDNPSGPERHFIYQPSLYTSSDEYVIGVGSAGFIISVMGSQVLGRNFLTEFSMELDALVVMLLDSGFRDPQFTPAQVIKWAGESGALYLTQSLGYNGWVALQSNGLEVRSTDGTIGLCYNPWYALGFAPLVFMTVVVLGWFVVRMVTGTAFGTKVLKEGYGGVTPLVAVVCPNANSRTVLTWEVIPIPHLRVVQEGDVLSGDPNTTLLASLRSPQSSQEDNEDD